MQLISGVSGFIGKRLFRSLRADSLDCRGLSRKPSGVENSIIADLNDKKGLASACDGVESVFHCAGYAHAFSSLRDDDAATHWRVNFDGTCNLLEAAGQAGVRRFVFLSSVKAMADPGNVCADENFPGEPESSYGQAKRAAENAVLEAGLRYGMHVVNLRLAMVYGAGGRGNLMRMGRLVGRGLFPPLPETNNHRSLVHVNDVVSAMRLVVEDERAAGRTYIVTSSEAPSGRELFNALRVTQGLQPCDWSIPEAILRLVARFGDGLERLFLHRLPLDSEVVERLLGSAWYSPARIEQELAWRTKVPLVEGLAEMLHT